jgi:hypothetical protein
VIVPRLVEVRRHELATRVNYDDFHLFPHLNYKIHFSRSHCNREHLRRCQCNHLSKHDRCSPVLNSWPNYQQQTAANVGYPAAIADEIAFAGGSSLAIAISQMPFATGSEREGY